MKSLWKEALHAWLTEPRSVRLSDLSEHVRRDVGIGPGGPVPTATARGGPSDLRAAVTARAVLGLQ